MCLRSNVQVVLDPEPRPQAVSDSRVCKFQRTKAMDSLQYICLQIFHQTDSRFSASYVEKYKSYKTKYQVCRQIPTAASSCLPSNTSARGSFWRLPVCYVCSVVQFGKTKDLGYIQMLAAMSSSLPQKTQAIVSDRSVYESPVRQTLSLLRLCSSTRPKPRLQT